ncbi:MAG: DUF3298 and DUF4163 domain-containing protein [Candidatus Omnitrophica bacterium]|nr:DUF3298 and DUF4163 domain-containing protein [Candidatus Omnitrophota bacterium]
MFRLCIVVLVLFCHGFSYSDEVFVSGRSLYLSFANEKQDIEVNWPVICGMKDAKRQEELNRCLFNLFLGSESTTSASGTIKIPSFDPNENIPNWFSDVIRFDTHFNRDDLLCLEKVSYVYRGGSAHGMTTWTYWLFDLRTGKSLELEDLLVPGFEARLTQLINAHVPTDSEYRIETPIPFEKSSEWFLTEQYFVIHFPLYAIAPYAAGPINVKIPLSEMKDLMREDGAGKILHQSFMN